ncbi:MAG TPA: hypothetical protein VHU89_13540 [Acidobacteriaceae bacterium]|jgi:hypothetical protein|nr:hypothetical protein [Acidobacteriaceae bacterium]
MIRTGMALVVNLMLLLPVPGGSAGEPVDAASEIQLHVVRQSARPVLTIHTPGAEGNRYGFEGGRVIKLGPTYHLFTSEMVGDPHWVKMRLAHWTSQDREHWRRVTTLFESSGDFTGKDPRAALWSPIPVFDAKADRWNLFYVAYAAAPDTSRAWLTNHEGRIWRAVARQPGREGIDGPWQDAGVVLERGAHSDPWEGLQGTDSFFPYQVGKRWYALYGSAHTERLPLSLWQVGLATAPELKGPWTRCTAFNPLHVEPRFIENPIVTKLPDGTYLAVYDNHVPNEIGYTISADGIRWSPGRQLIVQSGRHVWATEVRTPLGLVEEGGNAFTLFYTANEKIPGARADGYGINLTPGAMGFAEVRLHKVSADASARGGNPVRTAQVTKVTEPTEPFHSAGKSGGMNEEFETDPAAPLRPRLQSVAVTRTSLD